MRDMDFALGFIAGEGCFTVKKNTADGRVYLQPAFSVHLHQRDVRALKKLQETFGGIGSIVDRTHHDEGYTWRVRKMEECQYLRDEVEESAPDMWWETDKAENFVVWGDIVTFHENKPENYKVRMAKRAKSLNRGSGHTDADWDEIIDRLDEDRA
jgi:hypothetical protein